MTWSPIGTSQWLFANIHFGGSVSYLLSRSFLLLRVIESLCLLVSPVLNSLGLVRWLFTGLAVLVEGFLVLPSDHQASLVECVTALSMSFVA